MSVDHESSRTVGAAPIGGTLRRLAPHAVLLVLVLLGSILVIDPSISYSADEGAVIAQVEVLQDGTWLRPLPVPELDPDGRWFPLEASVIVDGGGASYAKHPSYPLLLRPFEAALGVTGMVLVSALATVAAALGTAVLVTRERSDLAVAVFWLTGVASPLFFDSFLVIAHTLSAALCAWAAVALLGALERRERAAVPLVALALLVATAVLLRSEALFLGPAFAVGALVAGRDVARVRRVTAAGLAFAAAGGAYLFDGRFSHAVLGSAGVEVFVPRARSGFVSGRIEGLINTWLRPAAVEVELGSVLILASAVCLGVLGALVARRAPDDERVCFLAVVSALLALAGAILAPTTIVPGLLIAFPLVLWLAPWARQLVSQRLHRVLLAAAAVVGVLVLATQYPQGGVAEWGGRYFAVALPLVIPSIVVAVAEAAARVERRTAQVLVGSLAVAALALASVSVLSLRASHERTASVVEGTIAAVTSAATDDDPIVVATAALIPRLSWAHLDEARWLLVPPDELPELFARAADLPQIFVVTSGSLGDQVDAVDPMEIAGSEVVWGAWTVTELCGRC